MWYLLKFHKELQNCLCYSVVSITATRTYSAQNKGVFALGDQGSMYAKSIQILRDKFLCTADSLSALYCSHFHDTWRFFVELITQSLTFQLLRNTLLTELYFKASILSIFTHVKRICILRKLLFRIYKAYRLGFSAILLLPPEHAPLDYILPR